MSVNDPIYPKERKGRWILIQGRETFYDENRELREWETKEEALEWARENLQKEKIHEHRP